MEVCPDMARAAEGTVAVNRIVSLVEEVFDAGKDFPMFGGPPIGMEPGHNIV